MTVNALYELEPILDNPKYEGFGMGEQSSLLGRRNRYEDLAMVFDANAAAWTPPHLAASWKPVRVIGRVRPFNDFPCLGLAYPVFSQRSIDILFDELHQNGELLQLLTSVGSYSLYNCTRIVDIIDFERSRIKYLNKNTILTIEHLQIVEDRLLGLSIFQMKKYPGRRFVTDEFARKVRATKLEGFEFRKIWPLPQGIYWELHRKLPECHDELTAQPEVESRPIKGNAVAIRLSLAGTNPTPTEKSRIETIANHLDSLLVNPRRNARYFGNLEIVEFVPGEARYFLSCPDADELAKKLKPWLKALDWHGEKFMLKRYGEFVDSEATAEPVKL